MYKKPQDILAKVGVEGSNPFARSNKFISISRRLSRNAFEAKNTANGFNEPTGVDFRTKPSSPSSSSAGVAGDGVGSIAPPRLQHVAICVCTSGRPKLLARCLASLAAQVKPSGFYLRIIVASNGPDQRATRTVVENFKLRAPMPLAFIHDDVANIARARNAAMVTAHAVGGDWVAFIDDDEVADPDWIANLMDPEYRQYPVLVGQNVLEYPRPMPFWAEAKPSLERPEPLACRTAGGGNVRFSGALIVAGLRFDERLGLTGGEDTDFFSRAHDHGFQIRKISRAITREAVHAERLTYRGQMYRQYWEAACGMHRMAAERGRVAAVARRAPTIAANFGLGLAWLAASLPAAIIDPKLFKACALHGGRKWAKAAGRVAAMFGHRPQPYRVIHGR